MSHIDVSVALDVAAPDAHHHLVTRRTGAVVRSVIERQIAKLADGSVAVLDFSHIGVLDRSCADEFVAKLVLPLTAEPPSRESYVVLVGVSEGHLDAIEAVLEAHGLALVVRFEDGVTHLVGTVTALERQLWECVMSRAGAAVEEAAEAVGLALEEAQTTLEMLVRRRLLRRLDDAFAPLGAPA